MPAKFVGGNVNYYEKNIEALKKYNPDLVYLIESTKIGEDRIKLFYSETGEPRILYKKDDGTEIYIHSAEDPKKCAVDAVDLVGKMGDEGIAVLFGFGLGYLAEELLRKFEEGHIMIIYEATPELFKVALKIRDIADLLKSEQVRIVLGENADNFAALHGDYDRVVNGKLWIVKHHPSVRLNESAYERFNKRLLEEKGLADGSVSTVIGLGKEFINTFMENVPQIIRKPGVVKLKDIFKGRPSIVVSAGPSLDKNFHLLKKAKGKAIIIAVDVVLPILLPANIIPDMVVAIDPLPENIAVFRDNPLLKHVPFICLAQYTHEILKIYPGPTFITSSPGNIVYQWLSNFWEEKGYVECFGGSVSHLAFGAAEYIGSEVIALVGQDLAYSDKYHAGDTTKLLHSFHNEEVPDYRKNAQIEDDIFGEKKYTVGAFLTFKTNFENKIKTFKGTVINATEGGLPIKGSQLLRLSDFIDQYCALPEIDTFSTLLGLANTEIRYNLEGLLFQVKEAKLIFTNIRINASKILKLIHRAGRLREKGKEKQSDLSIILQQIEQLSENVKHPILNIITAYHYRLELYLKKKEIRDIDQIEDEWERMDKQLWRGLNYYGELIEAIDIFMKNLNKLIKELEREEKINAILMDLSIAEEDKYFKAGLIYKKDGVAIRSVTCLEEIKSKYQDTIKIEVLLTLAEMYLRQFRFYEAKEVLTGIRNQVSGVSKKTKGKNQSEKITELIKECDEKIRSWEERKERMTQLLKKAEENYGGDLESGYFYFRVKDYERAEKAYQKAISSQLSAVSKDNANKEVISDQQSILNKDNASLSAAYYGLAHVYIAKEEVEKAVEAFEKAVENDPKNPLPYRDLGMMAYQNNNIESAELFFTRAIELAPQAIELYKLLCDLYVGQSEYQKAISLYEDALLANPDNPVIQQELATLYKILISRTGTA